VSSRRLEALAGAIADGEAVDWNYVERALPSGSARHLRAIWQIGTESGGARDSADTDTDSRLWTPTRVPLWLQMLATLALSQIAVALFAWATRPPDTQAVPALPLILNLCAFTASGVVLILGGRRDRRAVYLGALFLAIAGALSPRFLRWFSDFPPSLAWWRRAYVDAFAPLLMWLFVRDFPRLGRFTPYDRIARYGIVVSAIAGITFFVANIMGAAELRDAGPALARLSRNAAGTLYWVTLFGLQLTALLVAVGRTRIATGSERARVRLFALGFLLGGGPMLCEVLLGITVPSSRAWMARPGAMAVGAFVLYGFLALIPIVSAYSVLVQKVLSVRLVIARAVQYALARYTLLAFAVVPVALFGVYLLRHRDERLADLLSSSAAVAAVVALLSTLALLRLRRPLLDLLDRAFLRVEATPQDALASFGAHVGQAESVREIVDLLAAHVTKTLGVEHVHILGIQESQQAFIPLHGVCRPLRRHSAIAALALESKGAVRLDRSDRRSAFRLLPEDERRWVLDSGASLVQPIPGRNQPFSCLVVVGPRRIEREFSRDDLLFLSSVTAAASLALENRTIRDLGPPPTPRLGVTFDDELAAECQSCGKVQGWERPACVNCGGPLGAALVPATLLGKFEVEGTLGRGGMGVVYRATDLVLGRTVAVKTLPRLSADAARRLRHEARAMASVTHTNLAVIYGAETWRDTPFLVVEYLEGGTLADRLLKGPLPVREALELCATLADVLARLHAHGILHRDLKPSNIGFAADGTPKLLDFGLARLLDDRMTVSPREHRTAPSSDLGVHPVLSTAARVRSGSHLVGTPLYMSPEAIAGERPDESFDLWSLGVVLYESLAGTPPFTGSSVAEIFSKIRASDPEQLKAGLYKYPPAIVESVSRMISGARFNRIARAGDAERRIRELATAV
jgi:hypothetical protein